MSFENPEVIKNYVTMIQKFIKLPKLIELREKNFESYENKLKEVFPQFYKDYPSIFEKVIKEEDLSFLYLMLNHIDKIKNNENTKLDSEKIIGEALAEKYLYPIIGGKQNIKKK